MGSEQVRVVVEEEGKTKKRMGVAEPRSAPPAVWTPRAPAQEARLAALRTDGRDSRLKIFSGTANRPLAQVAFCPCYCYILLVKFMNQSFFFVSSPIL